MKFKTKKFNTDINYCARCQNNHRKIKFIPLKNAPSDITHFGFCPKTKQPILMKVAA